MLTTYPPEFVIGKREFEVANGNKVVDLEMGVILDYFDGPNAITRVLTNERGR